MAAIFFRGHPYIWRTTVRHDSTLWLVIFARDLFSRFSRVKSQSRKLKPRNFCCPRAKRANRVSIWLLQTIYPPNCNRSLSVNVPSTAIAQVIQEIKVLCQHRRTSRTAAQGRERKQPFLRTSWVRGYFSRHTGTKS